MGWDSLQKGARRVLFTRCGLYDAMLESLRRRLEGRSCIYLYDFMGNYTGFQYLDSASPGTLLANHPILYREPGTDVVWVRVNRLPTIRINELPITESQDLID